MPMCLGTNGVLEKGALHIGDALNAQVNEILRGATMRNHSATHLLHKALREVLGSHVQQKGSLVDSDKTRFDFSHDVPVTREQMIDIENRVNIEVLTNQETHARLMGIEEAQESGAMMLFGEKYGDEVRVLDIGSSRELCGGTHVERTGDIGLFKIVSESGVAAGVRRIEAVTGLNALHYLQSMEETVQQSAATLRAAPAELQQRIGQTLDDMRALEKEMAALKSKLAASQGDELAEQASDVKGVKVLVTTLDGADAKILRETMDKLKARLGSAVVLLASTEGSKIQLAAGVTKDLIGKVKAGELVNMVAQQVGGKGGGKPDMAMAGGTEPAHLGSALQSVTPWLSERL